MESLLPSEEGISGQRIQTKARGLQSQRMMLTLKEERNRDGFRVGQRSFARRRCAASNIRPSPVLRGDCNGTATSSVICEAGRGLRWQDPLPTSNELIDGQMGVSQKPTVSNIYENS